MKHLDYFGGTFHDRVDAVDAVEEFVAAGPPTVPSGVLDQLVIRGPVAPSALVIDGFVTIHRDGRVEVPEGVELDDAARAFWDAVVRMVPW